MQKFNNILVPFLLILQLIECQYISRGANYFHNPYKPGVRYVPNHFNDNNNGYNIYKNLNNDYKNHVNHKEFENPGTVEYYIKHKPLIVPEKRWEDVEPVHKPDSFVEDYSDGEYNEPEVDDKIKDSFHSGVEYEKDDQEHYEKDYKEAAGKKFGAIDKHLENGHREAEIAKIGGFHDKHLDARKELEHQKFKKDGEYSHDRGHGFIKAWSWDKKNIKGNVEGQKTKGSAEITAGEKGAFGAVTAKGSEAHDKKDLTAVGGAAGYGKSGHEESSRKSTAAGKSDYDKEFPIFG